MIQSKILENKKEACIGSFPYSTRSWYSVSYAYLIAAFLVVFDYTVIMSLSIKRAEVGWAKDISN